MRSEEMMHEQAYKTIKYYSYLPLECHKFKVEEDKTEEEGI